MADAGVVSVGSVTSFSSDSLAIRRKGATLENIVSFNSLSNGTAGTVSGDSATIAIGRNAGNAITTAQGTIAIGGSSLISQQSGQWNIGIGHKALRLNVSGNNNIAIGRQALQSYLGNTNIAIGNGSLQNATGIQNTAVGDESGILISSGSENSAFGYRPLDDLTTGSNNTAIGANALTGVTTGSNNTSLGSLAGSNSQTTKLSTTAIGSEAGNYSRESLSTWLGMQAGTGAVANPHTGFYNIGIGFQAMYNISAARTGTNNTVIGDRIDLPSITSNNQFVYGSNGVNWLTRFTGGGWLVNNSGSAVTSQLSGATFEINGTTGGILLPRLNTTQQNAISSPATGLLIWNTDSAALCEYTAGAWRKVDRSGGATGITSLNGLTGATQTFTTGTTGTDFGISSTGTTHTFNLPTASAVNRGALSTADWSTFNGKQDAIDTLTSTLLSDVAMTTAGTIYNGPAITLPAGTWLLMAMAGFNGTTGAINYRMYIDNGAAISGEQSVANVAGARTATINGVNIVSPASSTTYTMKVYATQNTCTLQALTPSIGVPATRIVAIKIK